MNVYFKPNERLYIIAISSSAGKSIPTREKVSFFVGLDKNYGPKKTSEVLKYDKVLTNDGSAYDIVSGKFTAPVNGTYHFTVVVAAQGRQKVFIL